MKNSKKKFVGILGGTFNPPHKGHIFISNYAMKRMNLGEIWWIVTKKNPLKKNQENISVYLLTVDKAKFRKPVCPGDTLFHRVIKKQNVKNIWKFKCTSFVNDKLVAEAEVSAIINSVI